MQVQQQKLQPKHGSPQSAGSEEAIKTALAMPMPLPEIAMELPAYSHSIASNGLGKTSV